MFRERTSSRLKRRAPMGWLSLCGTPSHSLPRSGFEKTPLGTLKNFFRFVKAKPDNLVGVSCRDFVPPEKAKPFQVVQAGGIVESPRAFGRCLPPCTKAQNTTEGTAHGIHRSAPENQRLRHTGFFALPLKVCCPSAKKVFGSTPFSKGVAGLQGGSPAKSIKTGFRAGSPARTLGCRAGSPAKRTGLKSKKDILEKRKRRGGEELLTVRRNPSVQSQED